MQRSQTWNNLKFCVMNRTKLKKYCFQSKDANRDDYNSDSNVNFFFKKLIYLHQLTRIKTLFHWYSNESLFHQKQNSWFTMYLTIFYRNSQRLSYIVNTWFIFNFHNFRIKSLWNFSNYIVWRIYRNLLIKVWTSMSSNRFLVFDLNHCKSFIRFWLASLHA